MIWKARADTRCSGSTDIKCLSARSGETAPSERIYVAGHRGMVGSALVRRLAASGYAKAQLITRTHSELDLRDADAVSRFFASEQPNHVYLGAARVGGILANNNYPAEFIRDNLAIETSVIHAAYQHGVSRLLFLGSSCIYPRLAPQPMAETALLTGPLEPTNRPYAVAKIAGIEMCWSYNRQYDTQFLAVMPTNIYGPGDNYHPENSHVIPALIRRFHDAKFSDAKSVSIWGTGTPRREFIYSEDMADACVHLMSLPDSDFQPLLGSDRNDGVPPVVNIGVGEDITISDLAALVAKTVGFDGRIENDPSLPDGAPRKLLDSTLIESLGWRARTTLSDGLKKAYEDFKSSRVA